LSMSKKPDGEPVRLTTAEEISAAQVLLLGPCAAKQAPAAAQTVDTEAQQVSDASAVIDSHLQDLPVWHRERR
jgi:hypothetical protein